MKELTLFLLEEEQQLRRSEVQQRVEASEAEWQRQISDLRGKLMKFTAEDDPQQVYRARQGLKRLATDFVGGREYLRPEHEIDWDAFKAAFTEFVEQSMPESRPVSFKVHPSADAKRGMHIEGERPRKGLILPRTISIVFDRYGLVDDRMTLAQIAARYGFASPERPNQVAAGFFRALWRRSELVALVYQPRVPNTQQ